jgi:hypothetical protein
MIPEDIDYLAITQKGMEWYNSTIKSGETEF